MAKSKKSTPVVEPQGTLSEQAGNQFNSGSRPGDFVLTSQPLGGDFRNVSKIWLDKCLPVASVVADLEERAAECTDIDVPPSALRVNDDATVTLDGRKLSFSPNGIKGLSWWNKINPTTALSLLANIEGADRDKLADPDGLADEGRLLFSRLSNWGMERWQGNRKDNLKLRLRGDEIRTVVSDKFAGIDNDWLMHCLSKIVPGGMVSHYRNDGDLMNGLLLIPDTIREETDSDYGGGIHFSNSEIGTGSVNVQPAVFRAICMNGCIWGQVKGAEVIYKQHSGVVDYEKLALAIYASIQKQIPLTVRAMEEMLALKEIRLASGIEALQLIVSVGDNTGVAQSTQKKWAGAYVEEGADLNVHGLIQGLTRTVRENKSTDSVEVEKRAGALAHRPRNWWEANIATARAEMDRDALVDRFGESLVASLS